MSLEDQEISSSSFSQYNITVLFSDNTKKDFTLSSDQTVNQLISLIIEDPSRCPNENQNAKILYHGHFLDEDKKLNEIDQMSQFTVFFVIQTNNNNLSLPVNELHGFDRLTEMGYTQSQIMNLRRQFHLIHHSTNDTHSQQIDAEDEWFPALFSHASMNNYNREADMVPLVENHVSNVHIPRFFNILSFIFGSILGPSAVLFVGILGQSPTQQSPYRIVFFLFGISLHFLFLYLFFIIN